MKYIFFLGVLLIFSGCAKNNKYTLTGSFSGDQKEEWIYMVKIGEDYAKADSARIENGKFRFEGTVETAELYGIHYQMDKITGVAMFFLEPGEIDMKIDLEYWDMNSKATGTPTNEEFNSFNTTQIEKFAKPFDALYSRLNKGDSIRKQEVLDSLRLNRQANFNYEINYVKEHYDSPVSTFILFRLGKDIPVDQMGEMIYKFGPKVQNTVIYQKLLAEYQTQVELAKNPKQINLGKEAKIMNSELGPDSLIRSLAKLNPNKVLFIDVWATWCGPCLQEFPYSKKIFGEIDSAKISLIYLCINSTETNWRKVIETEQQPGQHYLIGKEMFDKLICQYEIKMNGIPHYIIVGKDGKIKCKKADRPRSAETLKILKELAENI